MPDDSFNFFLFLFIYYVKYFYCHARLFLYNIILNGLFKTPKQ